MMPAVRNSFAKYAVARLYSTQLVHRLCSAGKLVVFCGQLNSSGKSYVRDSIFEIGKGEEICEEWFGGVAYS